ncbi:MAG: YihA family ribosome biogenesis GTP-binding protein [Verrucomicrobia bacterium]|nr:YihA family ribosome biogenesis GTP-binding protein [Verrucomicrobiota bacterium]
MKIPFEKAKFLVSALNESEWPVVKSPRGELLPEIALVGRSNVGKSSLINHLLQDKKVAKTSSIPGKTQRMNFFLVDERLLLIDLPGFGFAKAPEKAVQEWSEAIDRYFTSRSTLKCILLLIDSRRGPSEDDLKISEWSKSRGIPLLVILTKTDKLSTHEIQMALKNSESHFKDSIPFSIHDKDSRRKLVAIIQKRLDPCLS